jgi:hypothetical protein
MAQVLAQKPTQTVTSSQDALKYLGLIITVIGGIGQIAVGGNLGAAIRSNSVFVLNYSFILFFGIVITLFGVFALFRERMKFKINVTWYATISLAAFIVTMFLAPEKSVQEGQIQTMNAIGIAGIVLIFVALRPNFGPEANKRIYQASAGIFSFIIAILMYILGFYVFYILNIGDYAGRGTYPGGANEFYYAYIEVLTDNAAKNTYFALKNTGWFMMISAGIILFATLLRNRIGLLFAAILIFAGNIFFLIGVAMFRFYWVELDNIFFKYDEYMTQLRIIDNDPGVFTFGIILFILQLMAFAIMLYAAFAAKPIDEWRRKRDQSIAAAEVATREGRLQQAVKYLTLAASWSSKIDEEDKSIELLTRVKQIQDKAIKMRKSEAAEKAKKDYERQQKAEQRKKVETPKPADKPAEPPKKV